MSTDYLTSDKRENCSKCAGILAYVAEHSAEGVLWNEYHKCIFCGNVVEKEEKS